jgi:hypothetical protein
MGIGRSASVQYGLPTEAPQVQAPVVQEAPMAGVPVPEGLQWVDGQTSNIYQKWGAINQFAKTMKTQYGVDVTNPDVTDPQQVQISQAYQKGIADLYMNIDKFKNSQKMIADFNKRGGQFSEVYDPSRPFAEQAATAEKQEIEKETLTILEDYQKAFSDEATAEAATANLMEYKEGLEERLSAATNPTTQNMLRRSIADVKGALYDSTKDKDRWQRGRQQRRENIERNEQIRTASDTLAQIQGGETSVLGGYVDNKGRQIFDMSSVVLEPSGKISFKTNEYQYIDEDNNIQTVPANDMTFNVGGKGFKRYMTTMMRNVEGFDELTFAALRESPYYTGGMGFTTQTPLDTAKLKPDAEKTNKEIQKDISNEQAITRLSGTDDQETFDGLVRQLNTQAKSKAKLTLPKDVPMRTWSWATERYPDLEDGKVSVGNEIITEVEYFRNGIQFKDEEGNEWYLPTGSKAVQGLGDYSNILSDVFERNSMDVSDQIPDQYYETKKEEAPKAVEEAKTSTIVVDGKKAVARADGKIHVKNSKGQTGWVTVEEFERTGNFTIVE